MLPSINVQSMLLENAPANQRYRMVTVNIPTSRIHGRTFLLKKATDRTLTLAGGVDESNSAVKAKMPHRELKDRAVTLCKNESEACFVGSLPQPYLQVLDFSRNDRPIVEVPCGDKEYVLKQKSYRTQPKFMREIALTTKLDHPNIAKVHGLSELNSSPAVVMEKAKGIDGRSYIKRYRPVFPEACLETHGIATLEREAIHNLAKTAHKFAHAVELFKQLVSAVDYLQSQNLVHRDLKPENIIVDGGDWADQSKAPGDITCKIIDLEFLRRLPSLSSPVSMRHLDDDLPCPMNPGRMRSYSFCGTSDWLAPELYDHMDALSIAKSSGLPAPKLAYDERVDTFALGAIFYNLLTGKKLYRKSLSGGQEVVAPLSPKFSWHVPSVFKNMIRNLTSPIPSMRPSLSTLKDHWALNASFNKTKKLYMNYSYGICRGGYDLGIRPPIHEQTESV